MQADVDVWPELWPIDKQKLIEEDPNPDPRQLKLLAPLKATKREGD